MASASVELLRIPLKNIVSERHDNLSRIRVFSLSERYGTLAEPVNTIPVLVEHLGEGQYKLLQGHEIYEALIQSNERLWIWAMRLTPAADQDGCWPYEIGLRESKLNICSIDPQTLTEGLEYLTQNVSKLSKMHVGAIVDCVLNDPTRCYWSSLEPLQGTSTGLGKAALTVLSQYLEAIPQPPPPLQPISLTTASCDAIIAQLQRLCQESEGARLRKLDLIAVSRALAVNPDRPFWESSKDACKAIAALKSSHEQLLAQGFRFTPQPAPVPNTSRYLLAKLTVSQLRVEATSRGLPSKGMTKAMLLDALAEAT